MASRRGDRWVPEEPFSLPADARGGDERELDEQLPVRVWVQFPSRLVRVDARATAMTRDAVRVEWGERTTRQSAWVWRRAVRHRTPERATT